MDLWTHQPVTTFHEAIVEGFRGFTWPMSHAFRRKTNPVARLRAACIGAGDDVRLMLIDETAAFEFDMWCPTDRPIAVYPYWNFKRDKMDDLIKLCQVNVADRPMSVPESRRPVKGQKHRIVVTGFKQDGRDQIETISKLQEMFPQVELFVHGLGKFDFLFDWGFKAGSFNPSFVMDIQIDMGLYLPSGRCLKDDQIFDPRYADWFHLLGFDQDEVADTVFVHNDRRILLQVSYRSAQWAKRNFKSLEPFVLGRRAGRRTPIDRDYFAAAADSEFVLPATRRRTLRNLNLDFGDLDRFLCDTCILQNNCRLYRKGSVCTVKGSEGVALADNFGTRNADSIISGLSALLKRQAERLEDALAKESETGEADPEVTKQMNVLFANGTKMAKLLDPTLAGGPKVQVNVGVGAGGQAQIVAQADPRAITAAIVAELEEQGIPRDQITGDMIKKYLRAMGVTKNKPAIAGRQAAQTASVIQQLENAPEDYDPADSLPGVLVGELVDGKPDA